MPESNQIEYSVKVFKNDLQLLFVHLYQKELNFEDEKSHIDIDNYLKQHFILKNRSEIILESEFQDFEIDDESIKYYYKINLNNKLDQLEIKNTILLDLYFDQKNMLIFSANNTEKGYMFNLKQIKQTITIDEFQQN